MLLFKTIRYHLVTNPSQRIQDQAEFEILSGDVKQKARQLAEMERRLISADGCLSAPTAEWLFHRCVI